MYNIDKRVYSGGVIKTWQKKIIFPILANTNTSEIQYKINGKIENIILSIPQLSSDNSITVKFEILDSDSKIWYVSNNEVENNDYRIDLSLLVAGITIFKIILSSNVSEDKEILVYLRGE